MREIKFRAFHKETKTMISIQNMLSFSNDGSIWINENKQNPINTFAGWVGKDFVLMQYTGLKDKNGVEIYEGDIVECGFKYRSYLPTFIEEVSILNTNLTLPFAREWIIENKEYKDIVGSCKVIGNIYENSELLRED